MTDSSRDNEYFRVKKQMPNVLIIGILKVQRIINHWIEKKAVICRSLSAISAGERFTGLVASTFNESTHSHRAPTLRNKLRKFPVVSPQHGPH